MDTKKLIKKLLKIKSGLEGDTFTADNIDDLIKEIKAHKTQKVKSVSVNEDAREALREWAVEHTGGCSIQDGWPCGTCFIDLLKRIGLDSKKPEYDEVNPIHDRHNEVWRAILQIREAKL